MDTGKATKAMEDANEIARAGSQRQLRAYILPSHFISHHLLENGRRLQALLPKAQIKNTGQTPATLIKVAFEKRTAAFGQAPLMTPLTFYESPQLLAPIAPGNEDTVGRPEISRSELDKAADSEIEIYLFYAVLYEDIFGSQWETHWATNVRPLNSPEEFDAFVAAGQKTKIAEYLSLEGYGRFT